MADLDPYEVVQEDARRQLMDINAQLSHYDDDPRTKSQLLSAVGELEADLRDMQATVDIAARDPSKFNLTPAELDRRRAFVAETTAEVKEARKMLEGSPKLGQRAARSAAKEASDRRGLFGDSGSSSSSASHSRQDHASQMSEQAIEQQSMVQQQVIEQQDEELGVLSSAITRLGNMGKTINEELKSQGRLLDAFTEDVDDTSGRMRQAMGVMNKMLKSKDRGKFCAILVLTLVLGVLMYIVFAT